MECILFATPLMGLLGQDTTSMGHNAEWVAEQLGHSPWASWQPPMRGQDGQL